MTASNLKLKIWKLLWSIRAWRQGGLEPGSFFPDFSLRDTQNRERSLSGNPEAKLAVLWFTNFCDDCRGKISLLENLLKEAGDRYRVLAVSILPPDDPMPRQLAKTCSFPILLDPEDIVSRKLRLSHPPNTCPIHNLFIIDSAGRILYRHHLSAMTPEKFREIWRGLLGEQGTRRESPCQGKTCDCQ